jgi:hypothetical protein
MYGDLVTSVTSHIHLAPDRSFLRAPGHYRSHINTKGEHELGLCQHILGLILSTS